MWNRHQNGEVWYTSPLLDSAGVRHLFATRIGGVSEGCFGGWNFAAGVGDVTDSEQNVLANYEIAADKFGLHASDVCRSYQAHTDFVMTVDDTHRGVGTVLPKFPFGVDGLVSATENLLLSVRSADCVPILLYDPVQKVCSAVHAGWRGTVGGIAANAVLEMQKHGCKAADILAAIGPCIGVCCYEVGTEVYDAFLQVDACFASCFVPHDDRYLLDLTRANTLFLTRAGVAEHHIDACGMCTRCDETEWFSHRRMGANRGTMSAFITV